MRHGVAVDHIQIPKGESVSKEFVLERAWADAAVLTVYAPVNGVVHVCPRKDGRFYPLMHRGTTVKVSAGCATNIPAAACYSLRIDVGTPVREDAEFSIQALLDV